MAKTKSKKSTSRAKTKPKKKESPVEKQVEISVKDEQELGLPEASTETVQTPKDDLPGEETLFPETNPEPVSVAEAEDAKPSTSETDTFSAIHIGALASDIYKTLRQLRENHPLFSSLDNFTRQTYLGAYLLCGHILNREDFRGRVFLGRSFGRPTDVLPAKLLTVKVVINKEQMLPNEQKQVRDETFEHMRKVLNLPVSHQEIVNLPNTMEVEDYLTYVYQHLTSIRKSNLWMKRFTSDRRIALQGVQVVAGQLLGIGSWTLHTLIDKSTLDKRIMNAWGYARKSWLEQRQRSVSM
jgi:hypothetical protein